MSRISYLSKASTLACAVVFVGCEHKTFTYPNGITHLNGMTQMKDITHTNGITHTSSVACYVMTQFITSANHSEHPDI